MKVIQKCKECQKEEVIGYKCEVCDKISPYEAIKVSFGYSHPLDGEEFHFDRDECLITFFQEEQKKED